MSTRKSASLCVGLVGLLGCAGDATLVQGDEEIIFPRAQLAAPRLVAPLSTATVTTRRPPLRWSLAEGEQGAIVEVCRDRACRSIEALVAVTGSAAPSWFPALAPGVHFWRVYGFRGLVRSASPSATWEFRVGPRSAAVASSYGQASDYNGDGYSDLAIPASEVGGPASQVYVYHGSPAGLGPRPDQVIAAPTTGAYALEWAATSSSLDVGDLNGDGYSDMAVRAVWRDAPTPDEVATVFVHHGGPRGLDPLPSRVLPSATDYGTEHGFAISAAGDLNGDGYGDLALGDIGVAERFDDNAGFVHVYYGSADGVADAPDVTLANPSREHLFGWALAGGGDFNADSFSDLLATGPMRSNGAGYFRVFAGRSPGVAWEAVVSTPNPDTRGGSKLGSLATLAGDVNADGYSDAVVAQRGFSVYEEGVARYVPGTRYLVYLGGASGLSSGAAQALGSREGEAVFLRAPGGSGDVNGDGYSDLATPTLTGEVKVFFGGASGYSDTPRTLALIGDPPQYGIYGARLTASIAHDFNRDGYSDLYTRGRIHPGNATGVTPDPVVVLRRP